MSDLVLEVQRSGETSAQEIEEIVAGLRSIAGVEHVEFLSDEQESERVDAADVAAVAGSMTFVLSSLRLSVEEARKVLVSVRRLISDVRGVEAARLDVGDGRRRSIDTVGPDDLAAASSDE